jgi:hypothetical protein
MPLTRPPAAHRLLLPWVVLASLLGACRPQDAALGPDLTDQRDDVRSAAGAAPAPFSWAFTGAPAAPLPFDEAGWDVQIHSRDRDTWQTPQAIEAHHGSDCGPYPGLHAVTRYSEMVFRCRDHIMTAINASGYGAIVLTPDRLLDWSDGEAVLRFDISTLRASTRDWVGVWISAFDQQLPVPAVDHAPDLNGPPANGLVIEQTGHGNYCPRLVRNFVSVALPCDDWQSLDTKVPPSATRRVTVEVRLSASRIRVSLPLEQITFADAALPSSLPFAQGVVQFAHYSYTPTKCDGCTGPNTWHWDAVHLAPSVPFTIVRGDKRTIDGAGGTVSFITPAPRNARLRFSSLGVAPQLSFDGGRTWRAPTEQRVSRTSDPVRQYWTAIPNGARSVRLRPGTPITWWPDRSSWLARDFAVWAR